MATGSLGLPMGRSPSYGSNWACSRVPVELDGVLSFRPARSAQFSPGVDRGPRSPRIQSITERDQRLHRSVKHSARAGRLMSPLLYH